MSKPVKYSPEVRERAVRMVLEHQDTHSSQWAAIESIAGADRACPASRSRSGLLSATGGQTKAV